MTSDAKPYVINRLSNKTAEVLIYEQIGESFFEDGITAKSFAADVKAIGDVRRIDVRINSVGGSVFDGLAIYNTLKNHPATIVAHIDGVALSMASVIAMAASTVNMAGNALMMIHNPRMMASGDANDFQRAIAILEKSKAGLLNAYVSKTGRTADEVSDLMDAETWFTAAEAVDQGFADEITGDLQIAASVDLSALPFGIAVPKDVLARVRQSSTNGDQENRTMSNNPEQPAATLEQLEALSGADPAFVLSQLKAKATFPDAVNALNAKLADDLRVARAELSQQVRVNSQEPPAEPTPEPAPPPVAEPTPEPPAAAAVGIAPFSKQRAPQPPENTETVVDVQDDFEKEFATLRAQGLSAVDAMQRIYGASRKSKFAAAALAGYQAKTGRQYS